ncbi:Poly [ADP-ribose] polymerase 12 [Wickerhamomyces ciferrii]|uniref:Poly [ADP-ribose] polymerase 12 n=1 Tax=Wickerhamomyces ciferrii (strain ATCC 14091 / BCRC 22168 / CBS 111 / JCM 3599 / NBRC 0793 / NRRL Y-1031 F-60-10) TaxID=1206466 RepID=K0KWH0_WICCF|nr:Poly [ADP-ribose] polymerase 12 [Wickerhamomyces ciferrii]CCH45493.1 Poly [ADP-ribose] polymerase 12 [Wickerhamomyces ciferrii]
MTNFQEECNKILNNDSLFEEDKIDYLDDLVTKKYKCSSKEAERIILDILWKHKDPSRKVEPQVKIVKVEERAVKIDIPSFERRLELEKQVRELEALNEEKRKNWEKSRDLKNKAESEYQDLLIKTQELRKELYGEKTPAPQQTSSPIDQLNDLFNGSLSRQRIEQALRINGYDVIEAAQHLMNQLKTSEASTTSSKDSQSTSTTPLLSNSVPSTNSTSTTNNQPFFSVDKKNKALCSFLIKNGQCLRSDCKFSHDIDQRACSFWLKGNCLAGDKCLFKHDLDLPTPLSPPESLASLSTLTPPSSQPSIIKQSPSSSFTASNISSVPSFIPSTSAPPFIPSKAIKIVKPIKKPTIIPWEDQTENKYLKSYVSNRISATRNENQRKKHAKMSTDSYVSNDGGKAKKLSEKANKFEEKALDALKSADDDLYSYSETIDDEVWFEMHGLEFNDAVDQLTSSLSEVKSKYKLNSKTAYIVVPSSGDIPGHKKTTKPITIWLDHIGYRWQLFSCGNNQHGSIIGIDTWSI